MWEDKEQLVIRVMGWLIFGLYIDLCDLALVWTCLHCRLGSTSWEHIVEYNGHSDDGHGERNTESGVGGGQLGMVIYNYGEMKEMLEYAACACI